MMNEATLHDWQFGHDERSYSYGNYQPFRKLRNNKTDKIRSACLILSYSLQERNVFGGIDDLDDDDDRNQDEMMSDVGRWLLMTIWMMFHLNFEVVVHSVSLIFLLVRVGSSGVGLGCLVVQPMKKRSSVFVGLRLLPHLSPSFWSSTFCESLILRISLKAFPRSSGVVRNWRLTRLRVVQLTCHSRQTSWPCWNLYRLWCGVGSDWCPPDVVQQVVALSVTAVSLV